MGLLSGKDGRLAVAGGAILLLLSAIAGEFASDQDIGSEPFVTEREDGSLLIAGSMPADQMAERLGIELDDLDDAFRETLAACQ